MTSSGPPNKKPKCVGDKSVVEIQSILECPVCLLTPKNPDKIHICSNHHIICDNCKPKVQKCPTCRSENFQGKNPLLQKILSALPKICSFAEDGCEVEFEPKNRDEFENHLKTCQYRQIDCAYNNCNIKIAFTSLSKHIEDNHHPKVMDNERHYQIKVLADVFTKQSGSFWFPKIIHFDDQVFFIQAFALKDQMSLQCHFYGTETESKKYFCEISSENEALPRYKVKVNLSGDIISVDIPKGARHEVKNSTFTISMHMAKQLWNKTQEEIKFKITIKRE